MTNLTRPARSIGYCTNVHAGVDLPAIRENLLEFAVPARSLVVDNDMDPLGVGLWLPAEAARQLSSGGEASSLADFLRQNRLRPYTINGFPYDNFHQDVVKLQVYKPTWWESERLEYTKQLADVLEGLLRGEDESAVGSISTLPIGWPDAEATAENLDQAGANLRSLADHLRQIEAKTGRRIVVAIEPEPGCILDTTADVMDWFEKHLPETHHRKYLTVCHDICHSAVMMEPQPTVLRQLADAGITIGKVQVSSAIVVDFASGDASDKSAKVDQLRAFAEDRYMHQTGRLKLDGSFELCDDLPELIVDFDRDGESRSDQRWVVHFHVPIFLQQFGALATSQQDVLECLRTLSGDDGSNQSAIDFTGHLEIETYAWTVLPEPMRQRGLAADIAAEFQWLDGVLRGMV